jgi:hypothetical protein
MATFPPSTTAPTPASAELEALVALVSRLAVASSEATRLAAEVQGELFRPCTMRCIFAYTFLLARLPVVFPTAQAPAKTSNWVRAAARTPTEVELGFPEGSGETFYVVIRGREPGLYRTSFVYPPRIPPYSNTFPARKPTHRPTVCPTSSVKRRPVAGRRFRSTARSTLPLSWLLVPLPPEVPPTLGFRNGWRCRMIL